MCRLVSNIGTATIIVLVAPIMRVERVQAC